MREMAGLENGQINKLLEEGWELREYKMNGLRAKIRGLLCSVPFLFFVGGLYRMFLLERAVLLDNFFLPIVMILVICVPLHEIFHGLGWMLAGHVEVRGMIRFSFKKGMPFCSCRKLLTSRQYLAGLILPFFVLGSISIVFLVIYPGTLSILTALVNFILPGSDLLIAWSMLQSDVALVADIPGQAGVVGAVRRM